MRIWITEEDDPSGGIFSASAEFVIVPQAYAIREIEDFPEGEWAIGTSIGFPLSEDGTSDDYWLSWYEKGSLAWGAGLEK